MICNYFHMMHIKIEKIIIGNTQPVLENDLPQTSPEGSNVRDLQGIFTGHSGGQCKIWRFYEKTVYRKNKYPKF